MNNKLKIGVVGFSRNAFDKATAIQKLVQIFAKLLIDKEIDEIEIVSGYTASGVPLIAYQLADKLGVETVGFSAKQALKVRSGVHPVKKVILVGDKFGEESEAFVAYLDILVRIGGGKQSRHEVELFKKMHEHDDLTQILFEEEVDWYGK
ncbi:MAG: hypothetical protein ACKVTZ_02615 [Bacteroidia bacterium]